MKLNVLAIATVTAAIILTCVKHNVANEVEAFANPAVRSAANQAVDTHSYSNPHEVRVTHVDIDWTVDFDQKILRGFAIFSFNRSKIGKNKPLILDTRDLEIDKIEYSTNRGRTFKNAEYKRGNDAGYMGSALTIQLPKKANKVKITYQTSPNAAGLQWLAPEQTADRKSPFLFSQGQAILARSYIPIQDTPQVRITYNATVRTPKGLLAVMSAGGNSQSDKRDGVYQFKMPYPIPSYLIAIAVGNIGFQSTGTRSGVYAEPSVVAKAAKEFEDTEKMILATEQMYGAYRWGRYDLIVLPPSFPFGGMENPMLTFATPTVIAGDKSLVSLVAHELAHSWSGNLVTNATWGDSWMNEG
ncbi:MAG: M1 family aminopeptidase/hydrolase, partial [Pyrinomonadaceae bacterium]